mmetsp:Transcript_9891/g.34761  ORF Transcript_9891/g.34761 Transcript_9891/m.34761 type:complete len:253 (+) Transcript_9891:139-897(+)
MEDASIWHPRGVPIDVHRHKAQLPGLNEVVGGPSIASGAEAERRVRHDLTPARRPAHEETVLEAHAPGRSLEGLGHGAAQVRGRVVQRAHVGHQEGPQMGWVLGQHGLRLLKQWNWDVAIAARAQDENVGELGHQELVLAGQPLVVLAHGDVWHAWSQHAAQGCQHPSWVAIRIVDPPVHPGHEQRHKGPEDLGQSPAGRAAAHPERAEAGDPGVLEPRAAEAGRTMTPVALVLQPRPQRPLDLLKVRLRIG